MNEKPENYNDVKEILLNQLALIKQESERDPDKLHELTESLCMVTEILFEHFSLHQ